MPRKQKTEAGPDTSNTPDGALPQEVPDGGHLGVPRPDGSAAVYRDISGQALGGGVSEGRANFGAITAEALKGHKPDTSEAE